MSTQVGTTILRVSGHTGKNIASAKLRMFPDFVKRKAMTLKREELEIAIFNR